MIDFIVGNNLTILGFLNFIGLIVVFCYVKIHDEASEESYWIIKHDIGDLRKSACRHLSQTYTKEGEVIYSECNKCGLRLFVSSEEYKKQCIKKYEREAEEALRKLDQVQKE